MLLPAKILRDGVEVGTAEVEYSEEEGRIMGVGLLWNLIGSPLPRETLDGAEIVVTAPPGAFEE